MCCNIYPSPEINFRSSHGLKRETYHVSKRCKECGNAEALYREGMVDYFSHMRIETGIENLKRAANKGHVEASYVYGIILICTERKFAQGRKLLDDVLSNSDINKTW
ncbi:hypothetical protein Dimus_031317 [Dionaea muscipula]